MPTCIIVGAGGGLGGAIARRFGRGGHDIGLVARGRPSLEALSKRLDAEAVNVQWRVSDAGDAGQLRAALIELENGLEPCDVLVYNAAVLRPQGPLDLDPTTLRREFEVNAVGALVCVQHVVPAMKRRGTGVLLFTGGGLALEPYPEWASMALGKAALRSLALSLFKELAPHNIHVAVIAVCGIVEAGGPFDPDEIAQEYWRLATRPNGLADRELVYQPAGTDPFYNDPDRRHRATSVLPPQVDRLRAQRPNDEEF